LNTLLSQWLEYRARSLIFQTKKDVLLCKEFLHNIDLWIGEFEATPKSKLIAILKAAGLEVPESGPEESEVAPVPEPAPEPVVAQEADAAEETPPMDPFDDLFHNVAFVPRPLRWKKLPDDTGFEATDWDTRYVLKKPGTFRTNKRCKDMWSLEMEPKNFNPNATMLTRVPTGYLSPKMKSLVGSANEYHSKRSFLWLMRYFVPTDMMDAMQQRFKAVDSSEFVGGEESFEL